jgi:hypothetical protein
MSILKFRSAFVCLGLICAALVSAAEVEEIPKLKASNILPPDLLRSDVHTVSENVEMFTRLRPPRCSRSVFTNSKF